MYNGKRIRIAITDDHAVVRDGLRRILALEEDFEVVGEAKDVEETIQVCVLERPDVLLLDVWLPGRSGIDALPEIKSASPSTKILFLTALIKREQLLQALRAGLNGIVLKDSTSEVLIRGIHKVAAGEIWLDRNTLADKLYTQMPAHAVSSLTKRELEVVKEIVAGASNRHIAQSLSISEDTVKRHLTHIYEKTGTSTRLELALFASEANILD